MDDEYDFEAEDYREPFNISRTCILLKQAWQIVPKLSFGEFLNEALPTDLNDIEPQEMEEMLKEFIHQNE